MGKIDWRIEATFHKEMQKRVKKETKARSIMFVKEPKEMFLEVILQDNKKFRFAVETPINELREDDYKEVMKTLKKHIDESNT